MELLTQKINEVNRGVENMGSDGHEPWDSRKGKGEGRGRIMCEGKTGRARVSE